MPVQQYRADRLQYENSVLDVYQNKPNFNNSTLNGFCHYSFYFVWRIFCDHKVLSNFLLVVPFIAAGRY